MGGGNFYRRPPNEESMAKRISEQTAAETDKPPASSTPMVRKPTISKPATKMVNVSGKVANIPGMGAANVKPKGTIPIPKNPNYVQFLLNHGFELA